MSDILQIVKKAAIDAVNAQKPMELCFGTVVQEEDIPEGKPLLIKVEQKKPLTKAFFIDSRNLRGLTEGQKLILLRVQGGQEYYILEVMENDTE